MDIVIAVGAGLVGLLVGGVINVLADDLPHRMNPHRPHYPDGTPRPPSAWLGVLAFLTGQRESPAAADMAAEAPAPVDLTPDPVQPVPDDVALAADDSQPGGLMGVEDAPLPPPSRYLSWRHPIVEIVMALAFGAMAVGFRGEAHLPVWLVYVAIMMLITVIDVEHRLILFVVIVPSCLFALGVAAVAPLDEARSFGYYALSGVLGFAMYFGMFLGGVFFAAATQPGTVAFGFGDVMLGMLVGFMIGWRAFIFATLITVFVGAVGAVLYLIGTLFIRRKHRWFTPLPYGPYIVVGALLMLLFRDAVQDLLIGTAY
jgi:leader peptidase (prepilin peptidase) / N-methyltransferase